MGQEAAAGEMAGHAARQNVLSWILGHPREPDRPESPAQNFPTSYGLFRISKPSKPGSAVFRWRKVMRILRDLQ